MSEQQNCTIPAGGVTFTIKRVFALIATVALLIAIVAVQVSPRDASADEVQESQRRTPVETPERASAGLPNRATSPWVPVDGADTLSEAPAAESRIIDSTSGLNTPELQTSAQQAGRLPQEYEDALANWPEDEANGFREYYLENPDELVHIDVHRLIRTAEPVGTFDVRVAKNAPRADPSLQCGLKIAIVFDVSSSIPDADPNGIQKIKKAADSVIDQLAGTSTTLGLYNFAQQANVVPEAKFGPKILTESNAKEAKDKVAQLTSKPSFRSTDWAAGLEQVRGQGYDSVLFVTDGLPNRPGNAPGDNAVSYSLKQAQLVADRLIEENTKIIPIYVGEEKQVSVVVPNCKKILQGECTTVHWASENASQSFYLPSLRPRGVTYSDRLAGGGVVPESELNKVSCQTSNKWAAISNPYGLVYKPNACTYGASNNYVTTHAVSTPKRVTGSLAHDGEAVALSDFSKLGEELLKQTQGCIVNPPQVDPEITFSKLVRSQSAAAVEANNKSDAYDLGNDNDYPTFLVDYKLTNTGDIPVGYFELVDNQLEVSSGESGLTLDGLNCGENNDVALSSDKKTARVTLRNPLVRGRSLICTQTKNIVDLKFQNTDNPDAPIKYFGNEATVTAKKNAGDSGAATVSDNAWVKASPNLTLFKTFQGGPTRVVTGPVGQRFNTEYTVVLTNSGYVDGKVPELTDTPRTARGLKVIEMTAFNSPISNTGNLDAQNELIVGDQPVSLVDIDGDGLNWRLADDKLRVLKARHKGNFQIKVTYEVTEALQGADADSYICEKSRSKNNVGRGVNNTISAKQGNGIAEVRNANNAHVCISIQRADAAVTKKINDQGTPVNPSQSVDDQKSAKTISIPPGASEFKVSYVIRNNSVRGPKYLNDPTSELPRGAIVSAKVTDYVLDSAGNRTTKKVPVKNLSCSGENTQTIGTYDAASGVVTFNPPLAKEEEVTCSGTVSTAELDADDIVDGIHGDEVVVVPSYEVDSDQELNGSSEAVGSPISDKAWLKLPATFTMSKNAVSDTVVARGRKGDTFTAAYNVTVKNTSVVAGTPESIIESPAPISGVKAIKVVARNTDGSNTRLLSSSSDVTLQDNSDGTFTLNKSELAAIPGNSNANGDSQATIDVLVTYQITSEDGLSATSEYLECRASDNGRGLRNRVYFLSEPDNDADACISLAIPRIELEKLINGEKADDRDHATAILPGAKDVEIAYAVTNLGKPDIEWFTIGDRYGEEAQSGRSLSIRGLQCDRNVDIATSGSSSVKVTPAAPLTQGQTITCSWRIENGERMRYNSDGYHVNTATVNASFMQSNSQSTNPDIISSDRAWAVQLPALDGLLPKSGGFGVAPYGLGALILFAGAFFINRRGRKV